MVKNVPMIWQQRLIRLAKLAPKRDLEILKSIPGIAENTALRIISELGDIRRFNNPNQLNAFPSGDQQLVFFTNHLSHLPFSIDLSLLLPTSYYRPAGQKSVHRPAKFFQADLAVIIDIQDHHLVVLRQVGSEVLATVDAGQAMDDAGMANQKDPL